MAHGSWLPLLDFSQLDMSAPLPVKLTLQPFIGTLDIAKLVQQLSYFP
jgi:hypothetical protein